MSWPNRIRAPSRPSGWSAMDSASTTTGPEYHMTWARPPSLPRRLAGAISAMSVQEAGTSMPTASPVRTYPKTSIQVCTAKTIHSRPNTYSSRSQV
jgi:hypothetical protein